MEGGTLALRSFMLQEQPTSGGLPFLRDSVPDGSEEAFNIFHLRNGKVAR